MRCSTSDRIKQGMVANGLTPVATARLLGITGETFDSLDAGMPGLEQHLKPLAEMLGTTEQWLVTGSGPAPNWAREEPLGTEPTAVYTDDLVLDAILAWMGGPNPREQFEKWPEWRQLSLRKEFARVVAVVRRARPSVATGDRPSQEAWWEEIPDGDIDGQRFWAIVAGARSDSAFRLEQDEARRFVLRAGFMADLFSGHLARIQTTLDRMPLGMPR